MHNLLDHPAQQLNQLCGFVSRESCDTSVKEGGEAITASCHREICPSLSSAFYMNQPSGQRRCWDMNNRQVSRRNVPADYESNLCSVKVEAEQEEYLTCRKNSPYGMLLGLRGSEQPDLYVDSQFSYMNELVATTGTGLFMHGGNPIYYTAKGTEEQIASQMHAILRGNRDDLAGHHVILKVEHDLEQTGEPIMRVDRLPLTSNPLLFKEDSDRSSEDPVEVIYNGPTSSIPASGNNGWLYNLAGTMRSEQAIVDVLYPLSSSAPGQQREWSCPLLRIAFWSQVVQGFSPLVPSPVRAARLFGKPELNMIHGTRSHPTQEFASLFSRLGNVHTSNGFCFCLEPEQCRLPHSSANATQCTLLETIRSLYDQRLRVAKVLTSAQDVCKDQLDWPFEQGTMRDKAFYAGRNNASRECNVLDRLPLFQYRYMPVGSITEPEDKRTTVHEGGSCHMGRGTRLEGTLLTQVTL